MSSAELQPQSGGSPADGRRRVILLGVGVCLLAAILLANDAPAVWKVLREVRFAALAVVLAHLLVTIAAALGWWALLPSRRRPALAEAVRLRLIKEAINALLPVAQVGGDVVRARLAVSPTLPLGIAAASCILDAILGIACLAIFICLGLAATSILTVDPRIHGFALQLAVSIAVLSLLLVGAERLGLVALIDRVVKRSGEALGSLHDIGGELRALSGRTKALGLSAVWHLLSWGAGVLETWTALWAVGVPASFGKAFVLESLVQGVRAVGFAIPGALGVQEGGYLVICSTLGVQPNQAVALSLLRRLRELSLGAVGLALWRFHRPEAHHVRREEPA